MKPKARIPSKRRIGKADAKTFCEFFAGIGLVREGLEPSGWKCVYANDVDPKKQEGYEARFGKAEHFHLGDIWNTEEVIAQIPLRPSLMTASFPCVDLSVAGHYRGLDGDHSSTFFGFAKVLEALKGRRPPVIMLENVAGFLSSRKGQDFATAARFLSELGYWLDVFVLDACHFTPQSRPRVFVIGMMPELKPQEEASPGFFWSTDEPSLLRPENVIQFKRTLDLPTGWVKLPIPDPPERTIELSEVLDVDNEQEWWDEPDTARHKDMMSELHRRKVDEILASGKQWVSTVFRRTRQEKVRAEVRFDGLAGCLRTPRGGSAKQIVIAAKAGKLRMRWMSPREYSRLQGAPDFPLTGTTIQQLWGFADAVCVPAIRWIDQHVISPLYEAANRAGINNHARQSHA